MKTIFVLLLAFSLNVHASTPKEGLSKTQKSTILNLIDRVCGDTWCEGDYQFEFDSITAIKTGGYEVNFKMRSDDQNPWFETSCQFEERKTFYSYVEPMKSENGKTVYLLNDEFYSEMTECISEKESEASEAHPIEPSQSGTKILCTPAATIVCTNADQEDFIKEVRLCEGERALMSLRFGKDNETMPYTYVESEPRTGAMIYTLNGDGLSVTLFKKANAEKSAVVTIDDGEKTLITPLTCSR